MKSVKKQTPKTIRGKSPENTVSDIASQRLDTWLWASRFFKTRKLAAEAISAGHIDVNDNKAKPGKSIKINDSLDISKHNDHYNITIAALSTRRLSSTLAAQLFDEPEWSKHQRQEQIEIRKQNRAGVRYDFRKPDKRERKQMLKVKNQRPDLD